MILLYDSSRPREGGEAAGKRHRRPNPGTLKEGIELTPTEILHSIVDADEMAISVQEEALKLVDGFDKYVGEKIDEARRAAFAAADEELAAADLEETRRADEAVRGLDRKLEEDILTAKERFEKEKDRVVMTIFKTAVGLDA